MGYDSSNVRRSLNVPSSKGVSAVVKFLFAHTRSEYHRVPNKKVIGTRSSRNATRGIRGEPFEVANQSSLRWSRLASALSYAP